ncbi:unnamed protein product [Rotaria socialis]|uniref:NAD(P)(+)--arginine ADP-ribosyltransferase n=1 Tax=Rotaria socialis TaxID=392032 RepID=A0A821FAH2_9BILA|nr:unnamed protein product [Rotaria socialis]CAF3519228.1 unnamed protein product [Rotaria socialis]CAF4586654.1 unnamed protein product [Rotaria socialis]CAF4648127.1 unnamed protein product [Rotaria socialis]
MTAAVTPTVSSIFQCVRNFQWYWNSAVDPWSSATFDAWMKYTDIENEIIEDARVLQKSEVEIDGNYINLKDQIQFNKLDKSKQRPIKRVQLQSGRTSTHLREDRFSLPIITRTAPSPSLLSSTKSDNSIQLLRVRNGPEFPSTYYKMNVGKTSKTFADVIDEATRGMIEEGAKIGKKHEAEWLAKQLRSVKRFGGELVDEPGSCYYSVVYSRKLPREIGEMCVYLYTKECFWYKLINSVLRSTDGSNFPREQLQTLGPFSFLLDVYLKTLGKRNNFTVFRGVTLTEEERKAYIPPEYPYLHFSSFTSTSLNRSKAEAFGNTLFIIDLDQEYGYDGGPMQSGADISFLSDFSDEQEVLIWPATSFRVIKYEYDSIKNKHIIHMEAQDMAP